MLVRLGIRAGTSLAGIAVGLVLSSAVLDKFSLNATAVIEATLVFWVVHLAVGFVALKVLVREPSLALAGLLALAATIVSLIIVNAIVSGLYISGLQHLCPRDRDRVAGDSHQRHDREDEWFERGAPSAGRGDLRQLRNLSARARARLLISAAAGPRSRGSLR